MLKKYPIAFYTVWIIALFIFPAPLVLLLNVGLAATIPDQILWIDFGLVAYSWWLFEVLLSTRPSWLDRLIGLPALYLVHSLLGVGALVLAFLHRNFLMSMGRWIILTGNIAWYLIIFGIIYASIFMSGWFVDRLPVVARFKQRLQFIFKHQVSLWIHRLNLVAILLIWLHVHLIGRINTQLSFMLVFDAYTISILGGYLWHKWVNPVKRLTGRVIQNEVFGTNGAHKMTIDFGHHGRLFKPGDFFFFIFKSISKESHPFSVANDPKAKPGIVTIVVGANGDYTKKINTVAIGSAVQAEGPFGRFAPIIEQEPARDLVMIGMGTGIAPLLSIVLSYHDKRRIHVIWTVKNKSEAEVESQLKMLKNARFDYHIQVGRLRVEQLPQLMDLQEVTNSRFLIVGGATAVLNVEHMLHRLGVPRQHLTDERLTM